MTDKEFIAVFHYDDGGSNRCGAEPYRYAEEIVRCRECKRCSKDRIKWSVKGEDGNWIDTKCNLCRRTKLEVNPDDFCSYGVKRSEKPNNSMERSSE